MYWGGPVKAKPDTVDASTAVVPVALRALVLVAAALAAAEPVETVGTVGTVGAFEVVGAGNSGIGVPNRVGGTDTAVVVVAGTVVVVPEGTVVVVVAGAVVVVTGEHVVGIVTVVELFVRYPLRNTVETLRVSTLPASATGTGKLPLLVDGEWAKVKAWE